MNYQPIDWPISDPTSPYFCHGPTLISFSGGRTSAYMLYQVLRAHGGVLPDYVYVCFANTGKEREETLRFVHECGSRWGVRIFWLEGRWPGGEVTFELVGYNSASRNGEPFSALIARKQYLPNPAMRYCTSELKVRPMKMFMLAQGHEHWDNMVGLRGDEMRRVFKQIATNELKKERWTTVMPMATHAGGMIRQADVQQFWREQNFDLGIHSADGNCDLCFLKKRQTRMRAIRQDLRAADWWIAEERKAKCSVKIDGEANARFDAEESVEQLRDIVRRSPTLDLGTPEDADFDAECGTWCSSDD